MPDLSDDAIRNLLVMEEAARGAQTVSDWAYQRLLSHARHNIRPLCEEVLRLRADLKDTADALKGATRDE